MERPFILVDCNTIHRDEFEVKSGHHYVNAIFIVLKGSYKVTMDGKEELIKKGDVVIFSDYTEFSRTVLEPLEFIYIKFRINPKCPYKLPIPYGKINFKDKQRIENNTKRYLDVLNTDDKNLMFYKEHILEDILYQAYIDNFLNPTESINSIEDLTVKKSIDYINNNLRYNISVSDLCKQTATNPSTLNFRFKKETGMSPMKYVSYKKIEQAKILLSNSTYKISEIAVRCGFSDVYYFSNTFKKAVNMTPGNYRKQYI